jgi:hypothetical protein
LDVADLKSVCFDYIRAEYEGKEFRKIAQLNNKKKDSFFCRGEVWKKFLEDYESNIEPINETETSVEELRKENPGADLTKLLQARDEDWKEKVKGHLEGNLAKANRANDLIDRANQPVELLQQAIQTLDKINTSVHSFYDEEVLVLIKEISSMAWDFQQLIKKHKK